MGGVHLVKANNRAAIKKENNDRSSSKSSKPANEIDPNQSSKLITTTQAKAISTLKIRTKTNGTDNLIKKS